MPISGVLMYTFLLQTLLNCLPSLFFYVKGFFAITELLLHCKYLHVCIFNINFSILSYLFSFPLFEWMRVKSFSFSTEFIAGIFESGGRSRVFVFSVFCKKDFIRLALVTKNLFKYVSSNIMLEYCCTHGAELRQTDTFNFSPSDPTNDNTLLNI